MRSARGRLTLILALATGMLKGTLPMTPQCLRLIGRCAYAAADALAEGD